jgi:cobalamin biosynthesis Mg chelatase CobN
LWPHELEDESPGARHRILARLRQALRAERRRGLSGHWTYDLARHVELLRVYREELAAVGGRAQGHATGEYPTALRAARRKL